MKRGRINERKKECGDSNRDGDRYGEIERQRDTEIDIYFDIKIDRLAIYISAEIKLRDEKLLRRDIDFMEEFETFLGLFLSRAPVRDKNKPRKVEI